MKPLCIEAPATAADLGPGLDSLGLALEIADIVRVRFLEAPGEATLEDVSGPYAENLDSHKNLLCRAYARWAEGTDTRLPRARFRLEMNIPPARGLGSSAAAVAAGLAAAAHATEHKEGRGRLLDLGASLEGSAGAVAAALLGGMTAAFLDGSQVRALHVANHFTLGVGLFVPDEPRAASAAVKVRPDRVATTRAVASIGRAAYLTTALIWGRWEQIGPAMGEGLYRTAVPDASSPPKAGSYRTMKPVMEEVMRTAVEAGAYGVAQAGTGPSLIALGPRGTAQDFADAMADAAARLGWNGTALVTGVREQGVAVKEEDS